MGLDYDVLVAWNPRHAMVHFCKLICYLSIVYGNGDGDGDRMMYTGMHGDGDNLKTSQWLMIRDHSFLRSTEFWDKPRNLRTSGSVEFPCFHGILRNSVVAADIGDKCGIFWWRSGGRIVWGWGSELWGRSGMCINIGPCKIDRSSKHRQPVVRAEINSLHSLQQFVLYSLYTHSKHHRHHHHHHCQICLCSRGDWLVWWGRGYSDLVGIPSNPCNAHQHKHSDVDNCRSNGCRRDMPAFHTKCFSESVEPGK